MGVKNGSAQAYVRMIQDLCQYLYDKKQFKERLLAPLHEVMPFDATAISTIMGAGFARSGIYYGYPPNYMVAWTNQNIQTAPRLRRFFAEGPVRGYLTLRANEVVDLRTPAEYQQLYEPFGQKDAIMTMFFDADARLLGAYGCNQFSELPPLTEEDRLLFDAVSPFVFYAHRKYQRLLDLDFFSSPSPAAHAESLIGLVVALDNGGIAWMNDSARDILKTCAGTVPAKVPAEFTALQRSVAALTKSHETINLAFREIEHSLPCGKTLCFRIDKSSASFLPDGIDHGWLYVIDTRRTEQNILDTFSRRELDVLRLIKDGLADKEIAARLGVSKKTVQTYTQSLYKKLGVNNRTAAAVKAVELYQR